VPRLLQGLFAAVGDLYVFRLSLRLAGARTARWTLLFQLTSWFTFYSCTRTLTNSMEAALTAIALYHYPWPGKTPRFNYLACRFANDFFVIMCYILRFLRSCWGGLPGNRI